MEKYGLQRDVSGSGTAYDNSLILPGELYSPEFRQHFKTDGAVCSFKENTDGKFDFKIDGVSHVSWFRRKKD